MSTSTGQEEPKGAAIRETVLLAASAAVSFLLGLARTKIQALAFGPIGMGAIGLLQSSMSTATLITGIGADAVVTRELARSGQEEAGRIRDAAVWGMPVVAALGALGSLGVFFLLSARLGFASVTQMMIVATGAVLGVVSANLRAVLAGLRKILDLGLSSIVAATVATIFVAVLFLVPASPAIWALVAISLPLAQVLVFAVALNRHPTFGNSQPWGTSVRLALQLGRQSSVLAVAGVLPVLSQLLMRTAAHDALSDFSFGYFQSAMALAAISVSVLASSVGPSVLPRLSAAAADPQKLSRVVAEQVGVYLLLYAPVVLAVEAMPELVIRLVYSEAFLPVADQLRWQLVGEVLRLPCWVMATALTARGFYRQYLLVEGVSLVASVLAVGVAANTKSLSILGVALSVAVLIQFLVLVGLLWRGGVRLPVSVLLRLVGLAATCALAAEFATYSLAGRGVVLVLAITLGVIGVAKLQGATRTSS